MKPSIRLVCSLLHLAAAGVFFTNTASATVFHFASDPFAGSTAPVTPGRQIVGGEPSINFSIANDIFSFDPNFFNVGNTVNFASGLFGALPTGGANAIALLSFDNDANAGTPFGAANAADLIAGQITAPGAGFFIYFNSGLDLARLVYSTDLNDNTADLKIIARMTNVSGQAGRDAMATFSASNFRFATVPDSGSSLALFLAVGAMVAGARVFRRKFNAV